MKITRRGLFFGAAGLIAAPSIVRVGSLMQLSVPKRVIILLETSIDGQTWMSHASLDAGLNEGWHNMILFGQNFTRTLQTIEPAQGVPVYTEYYGKRVVVTGRNEITFFPDDRVANPPPDMAG